MRVPLRASGSLAVAVAVLVCGCGSTGEPVRRADPSPPSPGVTTSPAPSASSSPGYVTEGMVGFYSAEPFTIDIKGVERTPKLTVLRMEIMTTANRNTKGDFGYGSVPSDFARFRLFDPVGGKVYFTLRAKSDDDAFGTRHTMKGNGFPEDFVPGVRYPVEVYFPLLPPGVGAVSVVPDLPMGPMTGIPVADTAREPVARERGASGRPKAGEVFQWPVVLPEGDVWSGVSDVRELVETPKKTTLQEGAKETIGLRTDVLFAFDQATLGARAAAVLDEVAEETRRRADPAKPPVTIVGHTDTKGEDAYNQTLSVRRAQAVKEYLAAKLGAGYRYVTEGKGESAPIAKNDKPDGGDNPGGRARNRRVEISYTIKQQAPDVTATTGPPAGEVRGPTGRNAPFRPDPGAPVADFTWTFTNKDDQLKVEVLPLYRDGAYLVATFDVTAVRTNVVFVPAPAPFSGWEHEFSAAADFGAFTLEDPATKARYHPLKMSTEFVENHVPALQTGEKSRAYVYYPAPPGDRTSLTLRVANGPSPSVPITP
ncbi:OmpA family protein [Nonomuraea sp. NPDC050547]|uniref:OmpA family protein n=1 Tax=Nonomuraea sp. NPDC050547 TaxID=3364368 RepID=UPI0037A2BA47